MRIEYSKGERTSKELILLHRQTSEATSGRKMKVMLIFPPDWFPSEPYLSLPSLTAVLRQAGHTVIQKDINLEMWDWYFSEDFLKKVLRRVPQQLDRLRKLSKKRELSESEMDLQMALCDLSRQKIDELIKKAEKAKAIVRGETFYDINKLEWAIQVFREVTLMISMVYFPARICMPPMETDLSYKVFVSSEIMDAVNDTQVNIYRDVFEQLVKPVIEQEQPDVIGISIVLQQQLFSTMTFCALIKQHFPHIHVTIYTATAQAHLDLLTAVRSSAADLDPNASGLRLKDGARQESLDNTYAGLAARLEQNRGQFLQYAERELLASRGGNASGAQERYLGFRRAYLRKQLEALPKALGVVEERTQTELDRAERGRVKASPAQIAFWKQRVKRLATAREELKSRVEGVLKKVQAGT